MQLFDLTIALLLLAFAVSCSFYFGWLIIAPLLPYFRRGKSSGGGGGGFGRYRKAASRLQRADALIAEHRSAEAIKQLRRSIIFDVGRNLDSVDSIREHHQNFLSRCLLLAEEFGSRAENIADVERLFIERAELQKLLLKADESFRSLRDRREQAGKQLPSWTKADFEQRITEIRAELQKNEDSLVDALEKLFESLARPNSENIVYH